jgi:hypothetical protein
MSDHLASPAFGLVRGGRGSAGSRSLLSRWLRPLAVPAATATAFFASYAWGGLPWPYSSCQFHHAYGGVWG